MSPAEFQRLEDLFHELSELDPGEQENRLAALGPADGEITAELRRMLAQDSGLLDSTEAAAQAFQPRRFGPYVTTRLVGQGGMGAVFHARREDGQFDQEVAIKVMAPHLADPSMVSRFLSERRILAELAHPNVTRLLDGGVTPEGSPYLVMEYVEGEPIDVYADRMRLTIEARVQLFLQVCDAVSYAHRHLIVHRDLKPGNILVDRTGAVKLLDFGTAKLLRIDESSVTQTGAAMMTPRYASPEQARGQQAGTQSDVYSLGVVLYELLSGTGPFGDRAGPMAEFLRLAENRGADPLGSNVSDGAAANRGAVVGALRRQLSGDLRQILAACLQQEAGDRYRSVDSLRSDLEAWLENRPVTARPLTVAYLARKFTERHWIWLAAGFAALAAILWQGRVARIERDAAQRRFEEVRKLARLVLFDFHDEVAKIPGAMKVQRALIDRTLSQFETLAGESGGDPGVLAELAEGYLRLGDLLGNPYSVNLGETVKAVEAYRKALAILGAVPERRSTLSLELARGKLMRNLGRVLWARGQREEGVKEVEQSVTALERASAAHPEDIDLLLALYNSRTSLGDFFTEADPKRALEVFDAALGPLSRIRKADPEGKLLSANGLLFYKRGACLELTGNLAGAIESYRAGLEENGRLSGDAKRDPRNVRARASLLNTLAMGLAQTGKSAEALTHASEAVSLSQALAAADPDNVRAKYSLAVNTNGRNLVLRTLGDHARTLAGQLEEEKLWAWILSRSDQPGYLSNAAVNLDAISRTYALLHEQARAAAYCGRSIRMFENVATGEPLAEDLRRFAAALLDCGDAASHDAPRAAKLMEKAVGLESAPGEPMLRTYGKALLLSGRKQDAAAALEKSMALLARDPAALDRDRKEVQQLLAAARAR